MSTKNTIVTLIALILIGLVAYRMSVGKKLNIIGKPDAVIKVDDQDEEMNAAMKKAKSEFKFFTDNWKTMKNNGYSLKFWVRTDDNSIEYIWFNPISIDGNVIKAECANDPENIRNLKIGDIRELNVDQLSDWMIMAGNKCYGGYTIRVLVKRDPSQKPPFEFAD